MRLPAHSLLLQYGTATGTTVGALGFSWLLGPTIEPSYLPPFLAAVFISTWCGGWGPGLLASLLSAGLVTYFFLPPVESGEAALGNVVARLALFALTAVLIAALTAALRAARNEADLRLRQVEENRRWCEALMNLMPQPLVMLEPGSGRLTFANQSARSLANGGSVAAAAAAFHEAIILSGQDGNPRSHELELEWQSSAGRRTLAFTSLSLPPMHGFPATVVVPFRDVTQVKQTEQQITAVNQQLMVATLWAQELAREAAANERRSAFLSEVGGVLAGSLDYHATLKEVARLAVGSLADLSLVDLVEPDGTVRRVAVAASGPAREEIEERAICFPPDLSCPHHPIVSALDSGTTVLVPDVTDDVLNQMAVSPVHRQVLDLMGPRSLMSVPLIAHGRRLGAITMMATTSGRQYGPDDVKLAEELARRAALAVDNARLYYETEHLLAERTAILDQMPSGVVVFDARGVNILMNQVAQRVAGAADVTGMSLAAQVAQFELRAPQADATLSPDQSPTGRALAGEAVHGEELKIRRPGDTQEIWIQVSAVPLRDSAGHITGGVAVFEDITVRKTLEQLKDEFLSLAAHELKTPLATIKGNSQLLLRRNRYGHLNLSGVDADTLRIIDEKTSYMGSLIEELLDLTRMETGRLALHPEQVDLAALMRQLLVQQRLLHPGTPFMVEGGEQPIIGNWDRGRLEQVFSNLLDNAVKYSAPGAPVRIILERLDGEARVAVRDEGIGIPMEEQPHVFDRHFRAGNAGLSRSGLGLGLYLSRQIVERHGGRIWVDTRERAGSTFTVALPLAPAAQDAA